MKVIVFDTETNGKPKNYNLEPSKDLNNFPKLIQIGYIVYDLNKKETVFTRDKLILPAEDMEWDEGAFKVHGITKEKALELGQDLKQGLLLFQGVLRQCNFIVAHNYDFDRNVILSEFLREELIISLPKGCKSICTMKTTKSMFSGKWPKLKDLHQMLFNEGFEGAHDAFMDVKATLRCFVELYERGHYDK